MTRSVKTLIVTGGGRGIGAATAILAGADGWNVVLTYRERTTAAEKIAAQISAAGSEAMAIQADTADEESAARVFDAAEARFGPVTGLVNNAGVNGTPTTVLETSTHELRRVFDVNVMGTFFFCREAVRRMSAGRGGPGGAIVNVASVAAARGNANERVHYAASKAAVVTMTTGLAHEVARSGIRVNAVSPGLTETDLNPAERIARVVPTVPIGRVAQPEEIASVILFLLSPASSYMVGVNVTVSGGR